MVVGIMAERPLAALWLAVCSSNNTTVVHGCNLRLFEALLLV